MFHLKANDNAEQNNIHGKAQRAVGCTGSLCQDAWRCTLAYNVGPYRILDGGKHKKSELIKKIERGNRNFKSDYLDFCHWKGKFVPSIRNRRRVEWRLLYIQ